MAEKKEKTSLIQMLNTSIGNISGLFRAKKESTKEEEIEIEEITASQDKAEESFMLQEEEEEFEKDLSRISIPIGEEMEENEKEEKIVEIKSSLKEDILTNDEVSRLKKIIVLKDEIRRKEREREKEKEELNTLENIKIRAELDYERKRRKMLQQVINSLEKVLRKARHKG